MKSIKTRLEFNEYEAFEDRIAFKGKCYSNGCIRIPTTLKHFSHIDYAFIKVNNSFEKIKVSIHNDRNSKVYCCIIGKKNQGKVYEVYLRTNERFSNALKKLFQSSETKNYSDDMRINISEDGKLVLKFLVSGIGKFNSFGIVHNILKNRQKSILFKNLKKALLKMNLDLRNFSPFMENYFFSKIKNDIKPLDISSNISKEISRMIGLVNGDGHLSDYSINFYNSDKKLHDDFETGIKSLEPLIKIKKGFVRGNIPKSYIYSRKLAEKLKEAGCMTGNKTNSIIAQNIEKLDIIEYLSGIYDSEGCFIKDSHIIIPASVCINNICFSNEVLDKITKKYKPRILPSSTLCYSLSISKAKEFFLENTFNEIRNKKPNNVIIIENILKNLSINSKTELKSISIYPDSKKFNANWWIRITKIEDVIKFSSLINLHSEDKNRALNSFVSKYIDYKDFDKIKNSFKEAMKNGSAIKGFSN